MHVIFWEKGEHLLFAHLYAIKYVLWRIILLKILFCLKIHVKGIFSKKVLPYPTLPYFTLPYPTLLILMRAREHSRKFKMADEAVAVDENFPRYSSELRSMRCEQSLLNKTDGSASFLQGNFSYLFIPTLPKSIEL